MKDQHKLDRLLKDKFDAREFEFSEAYWEEAEGLIAAAEAVGKKPLGFWWRWLLADTTIVVTLLAGFFLFSNSQISSTSTSSFITENTSPKATSSQSIPTETSETEGQQQNETASLNPIQTDEKMDNGGILDQATAISLPKKANSAKAESSLTSTSTADEETIFSREKSDVIPLSNLIAIDSILFDDDSLQLPEASPASRLIPVSALQSKIRKHRLAIVAGLQSSQSFSAAEGQRLSHWPTVGVKYSYAFNSRLSLQSGLMLENRAGLNFNKVFTSTQFGFGRNEETVFLRPQSMHSLAMPLQLGYRFHKKHRLFGGVNASYLLNVRSLLETQSVNAFGTITTSEEKAWGYRQGIQKWDTGLLLGYQFDFSPRMGLMLEAYQGLRDISNDAFWEIISNDQQRQLRLKLYWNLF